MDFYWLNSPLQRRIETGTELFLTCVDKLWMETVKDTYRFHNENGNEEIITKTKLLGK